MDKEIRPIKRSPQLQPLSREHHDGLLFAWKIKRGNELRAPVDTMRRFTLWYWKGHIRPHFFQEEQILMPYLPDDHPLKVRLREEHNQIRELILGLDAEADRRQLTLLADLLNQHIRFEERELFGVLEQTLTAEQLDQVRTQLDAHPLACEEWPEPFWLPAT